VVAVAWGPERPLMRLGGVFGPKISKHRWLPDERAQRALMM
jgi:hypothetical protein